MKQLFILIVFTGSIYPGFSQKKAFPENFTGNWKGRLTWTAPGKPSQTFLMQLNIHPADTAGQYTFTMIYGDSGKDIRKYILKPVDTAKGHWAVDEKDGIVINSYVNGSCLQGAFTVMGSTVIDNYCVQANKMTVQFFTIKLDDKTQSGKGTDETPYVYSYRMGGYQTGVLTRIK